jgi:Kef-type K+ transport system membrane component KefB
MNSESRRFYAVGVLAYLGLLFAGIVIVLGVLQLGNQWGMVEATSTETHAVTKSSSSVDVVFHVLFTLAAVIFLGAIFGRLCRYFGQPPVIGEVIAGLSLGPSLLGAISPDAMHLLIPSQVLDPKSAVATSLKVIAQLGVILYMFLVGLELNAAQLKHKAHAAVAISHASIVVPFTLGTILSLWLYPMLSDRDVPFVSFALFLGVAMSITAFPVLARILTDRNLQNTPVGTVALSCAAADDVTAWCLLSLVVGIAKSEVGNAAFVVGGALAFILIVFFVARPLLVRYVRFMDQSESGLQPYAIVVVYVMILGAAALTEWIGIHAIFGAFLLGVIIPSDSSIAKSFQSKLKEPVTVLLLPAFFAYTGMRTEIGLLNDWSQWLVCLVIIFVATLGKFGGTLLAARYAGESWREAGILGMLMNTRGLMELIVLNIGLDLGVISPTLFAMMVIMALVTTITTAPALQFLSPPVRTQHGH